ncbi:MAG: thiamine pyrophosphate-requiring protein [Desulfobacteraceae bacterium]|nr:MAG: thiamine pyrophosphate-requiring protein [Desulfobacteraceae bacterium]
MADESAHKNGFPGSRNPAWVCGPGERIVEAEEGHELILHSLAANGVDCLFFCGGSDNYMFMESVEKFEALGRPTPRLFTCLHESVALTAAYGHFMVSRRPQAVILHVDNGTLNAGGAWTNARHGNGGVVVMAGRAPWTTRGELEGSHDNVINYVQESYDQGSIVRQYVKWDYELRSLENAGLVMQRAFRIAGSEPCGPVYVTLPRELLRGRVDGGKGHVYGPETFAPSVSPQGDSDALREAARLLVEARNPVVCVKRMGRHPQAVARLVSLAEKLALPVMHHDTVFLNFPYSHPLLITSGSPLSTADRSQIEKADVLLLIDHDAPWLPSIQNPPPECRIISLDLDPLRLAQPTWDFPVHLPIVCDSAKALPLLTAYADEFLTAERRKAIEDRMEKIASRAKAEAAVRAGAVERAGNGPAITPIWLGACLNDVVNENTIVVQGLARGVTPGPNTVPGHFFGIPASSLGWALPAGIGAKIASPDKTVISASGDGGFVFANPEACLWMAGRYGIHTLHIICNNGEYLAVKAPLLKAYPDGYSQKANRFNGTDLHPLIDFTLVARACGAYAERVSRPGELPGALERCLAAVHSGRSAVLDVILDSV